MTDKASCKDCGERYYKRTLGQVVKYCPFCGSVVSEDLVSSEQNSSKSKGGGGP